MKFKHGQKRTRLYNIWCGMKQRINYIHSVSYPRYGGKGIKICLEWENDFIAFRDWALNNGYEHNLTLDRINSNSNYEPSNCRWATRIQQGNNTIRNRLIEYKGKIYTISEIARLYNINRRTLIDRLKSGLEIEEALTIPIGSIKRAPMSAEHREKISKIHKGKVLSEETKQKMRKPKSEEHKANISKARLMMGIKKHANI